MPRVEAVIEIDRRPADVFAAVADPERRRRLLPDNFRDFRVVSETAAGPGTRTAFTIVTPHGEHATEVEVRDWDPPHSLTEQTLGPNGYAMRWSFRPHGSGSRVVVATEYTAAGSLLHRLVDRWFARKALQNSLLVELTRLKRLLEDEGEARSDHDRM